MYHLIEKYSTDVLGPLSSSPEALYPPPSGEPTRRLCRHLPPGASGQGPRVPVAACVPATHPLRPWADTLPWATQVEAIEHSVAQRLPKTSPRGRRPGATRV